MNEKRYRLKFTFWLDVTKTAELWLADEIENLKNQRLFSQTIRDGIRLMAELRAGRTDTLFSLFPWLVSELSAPQPDQELTHEIARLRELIMSQGAMPALTPPRPAPLPDADLDVPLTVTASKSSSSAQNFLNSLASLQQ